ncbi:DNA polymerase IV [Breznakiellaceae bacterium SP9]
MLFIHADLDAFYASVEQLDQPLYRGRPVIVGGLPGDRRSVVSTASYEARKYGVHSAMPIMEAYRLCPCGIYVRPRFARYAEKSAEVMRVFSSLTPTLQQISIDEAFLDISGMERVAGPSQTIACTVKESTRKATGLTVSLGIASNKYLAKIVSGLSKPDGVSIIAPGEELAFMCALPVGKIWGAGPKTQEQFRRYGFKTGADLYALPLKQLQAVFGDSFGDFLYKAVRGQAAAAFATERTTHSISAERTVPFDISDLFDMESVIFSLCETLLFRLLDEQAVSQTVHIKIRYNDFSTEAMQETFPYPIATISDLFERVCSLFRRKYQKGRSVRLIGVSLMKVQKEDSMKQGELFTVESTHGTKTLKEKSLEKHILTLNKKWGNAALTRGRSLLAAQSRRESRADKDNIIAET